MDIFFRYYGYGFFPQYPYDVEGGTIMVLRGDYPTVQEQLEEDALMEALNKGKTKEQAIITFYHLTRS